jgi:hypothetical protein
MSDNAEIMLKMIQERIDAFEPVATKLLECLEPFNEGMKTEKMMVNIKFYQMIKYVHDFGKELQRVANVVEPEVAERIVKCMTQEDMDSVNHAGYSYAPDTKTFVSVPQDSMQKLIEMFKADSTTKELVKESVHPKTLESYVKCELAEGRKVNPLINVCEKPTLKVRKLRGS